MSVKPPPDVITSSLFNLRLILLLALMISLQSCAQSEHSISKISLQRTSCFGTCPVYTVVIYPDGLVEFSGERFVESLGDYSSNVNPESFQRLAEFANAIDFFQFEDEYRVGREPDGTVIVVSDLPSRITTVIKDNQEKSVLNYFAGPDQLTKFEELIDELTESAQWIGEADPPSF